MALFQTSRTTLLFQRKISLRKRRTKQRSKSKWKEKTRSDHSCATKGSLRCSRRRRKREVTIWVEWTLDWVQSRVSMEVLGVAVAASLVATLSTTSRELSQGRLGMTTMIRCPARARDRRWAWADGAHITDLSKTMTEQVHRPAK